MNTEDFPFVEFLDDYFIESEEHLGSIRRCLLVLEAFVDQRRVDPSMAEVIGEMLNALHSLKGLSAMVGIDEAEQVAHAMETCLRGMKLSCIGPGNEIMEALTQGANTIEQVVMATRRQAPLPDISAVLFLLSACDGFRDSSSSLSSTVTEVSGFSEAFEAVPAAPSPSVVRVDLTRLDHLMTLVGDLVISRGHVDASLRKLHATLPASAWRELQEANLQLSRQLRNLRDGVLRARMVPVGQIFERLHFAIRGLERENRKEVRLELIGQDIEIDKHLVERMMDPLLHMVRNAVTHGLESSEDRLAQGKSVEGHLRLRASTEADTVVIELEDDGRGMDLDRIASRSRELGLMEPGENFDSARALQMICATGFSTRVEADLGAGRGIGMTIVKTAVNGLGGSLAMDARPGQGTRFTIRLPLTLTIMQALIVYLDEQPFAVPRSAIREVFRVEARDVVTDENVESIPYRGGVLPVVHLARFFGISEKPRDFFHVFVAGAGSGTAGIMVDRIGGQPEIVVRNFDDPLIHVPGIAGATELGDGRPVLILDTAAIVDASCLRGECRPEMVQHQ